MLRNILIAFGIIFLMLNISFSQPLFLVENVSPKEVKPGFIYNLTITLVNLGNEFATYLRISLDPEDVSPIDPIGKSTYFIKKAVEAEYSEKYFGVIKQYEKINITIPIFVKPNVKDNVYITPIVLKYKDPDMKEHVQRLTIGILVRGYISLGISDVKISPKEIRPGYKGVRITISLKNSGSTDAKEVIASLNISYPFKYSYSSIPEKFLGDIPPGRVSVLNFFLDVDKYAKDGEYSIPLILKYKDRYDRSYEEVKYIKVVIKPRPYIEVVSYNTVPKIVYNGDKGKLYIKVRNVGEETARNIEIRIIPDVSHPIEFEDKTFFIASLKSNEEAKSVFNFKISRKALENDYILKVLIRYSGDWEENDYNIYTREDSIKISVKHRELRTNIISILIAAIILIALTLIYKYKRK